MGIPILSAVGLTEFLILITSLCMFSYYFLKRPNNFPPGPPRLPIIGNLHQLRGSEPHKTFMKLGKKYGSFFSFYFAGFPAIIINDYKLVREAFSQQVFSGRANFLEPFKHRTGGIPRGVIFTHEKPWIEQRRFALKTLRDFGFGKKSMESVVQDEVNELIETFKKLAGKPLETQNKFNAAVLNALWFMITGTRYSHDDPLLQDLIKRLTSTVSQSRSAGAMLFFPFLFKLRVHLPWLFGSSATGRTETHMKTSEFIKGHIAEHVKDFQPDSIPRDFIDVYLAEMSKTTDQTSSFYKDEGLLFLRYTMIDLFIAGAETTSTTLTWAFLLLALHPESQEKLNKEITQVVGTSRLPSLSDRPNMPLTEAVIMEVMRFSAMVPLGVFHTALEDTTFQGYNVPKDTIIVGNMYNCMRDPDVWGDPDTFRPQRFLSPDGSTVVKHEALLPFSTGKRVCLGETLARDELFLFMSSLFQRFKVGPDPAGPKPQVDDYYNAAVLIPKPHKLVITDRYE